MASNLYKDPYETIKVPSFKESDGFYTTKKQSHNMGKIKAKNTKPELIFRKALWKEHIRYRKHVKSLSGTPDIAIKKYKLVIFIDGSFWHGYQWEKRKAKIKTNRGFWIPKIERNMQRDQQNRQLLENAGYTVMRFWDHEVKQNLERCINQIKLYIETAKAGRIPISGH